MKISHKSQHTTLQTFTMAIVAELISIMDLVSKVNESMRKFVSIFS